MRLWHPGVHRDGTSGKERPMRRICVMNQKGGVGKTTTVVNLGAALAHNGWRVLMIDLDPQAHLSLHFGVEAEDDRPDVYDVLTSPIPIEKAVVKVADRLSVLPSSVDLAGVEVELPGAADWQVTLRDKLMPVEADYDVLMIDCPPSLGVLTINAMVACYEVLIPLQPHFLALHGLVQLFQTVARVRSQLNPRLRISGIAICMNEAGTILAAGVVEQLKRILETARSEGAAWSDARLFKTRVRRNIKLAESPTHQVSIFDYAPKSNGAIDYRSLAEEIFSTAQMAENDPAQSREVQPAQPGGVQKEESRIANELRVGDAGQGSGVREESNDREAEGREAEGRKAEGRKAEGRETEFLPARQ